MIIKNLKFNRESREYKQTPWKVESKIKIVETRKEKIRHLETLFKKRDVEIKNRENTIKKLIKDT